MRSLHGIMVAVGAALGAVVLAGLIEVGCGDDSSSTAISAGPDATGDQSDTRQQDGGDSALQGTLDGGGGDAAWDAIPPGLAFAISEATAYCTSWLNCCPGGPDGGYDLQRCVAESTTFGWEGTLPLDKGVYSRGHVIVNQAKAAGCLSALTSFRCAKQTPAQWGAITSACELVVEGTIPSNSPGCISSFECAAGNYCDPTVVGGMCTPLATQGQPCNTKINDPTLSLNPLADEMCSYLSSGQPPLFCDLIDSPPDAATCQPLLAKGASCDNAANMYYDDQACTPPGLCGDNLQCGGTTSYPYPNFCQLYGPRDAGGPG